MIRFFSSQIGQINRSVAAVTLLLERPKSAQRVVILLLAIHSGLLVYSGYIHSPTLNEPGHLVAGLSYWNFGRFDVYNVNPPFVKLIAALPVMTAGYEENWSAFYTGRGARPELEMGADFVAANGDRAFFLFMIARWSCIPFSWLGGIVCYLWARDLDGRPSGVFACAIWCFEPNIMAHASLMTPDAHASSLGLAACYTFWRWLKAPTWPQVVLTGLVLGLAELAKTTLILFYPLWPLMWIVYRWGDRASMTIQAWLREASMLAVRMLLGLYVLNFGYAFEGSLEPLGEFEFTSDLFTGQHNGETTGERGAQASPHASSTEPCWTSPHNRFAGSWLDRLPIPLPRNYLLGIDIQQSDFEDYGRPSFLGGDWGNRGWWYYYLYAAAIKVPLGLLLLIGFGAIVETWRLRRAQPLMVVSKSEKPFSVTSAPRSHHAMPTSYRDEFILLLPPIAIFIVVSAKSGFSEHLRYALPCFPFAFIWASRLSKSCGKLLNCVSEIDIYNIFTKLTLPLAAPALVVALLWVALSSLWIYPHSLSYFNECVGGPLKGPGYLLGSNCDWGQDERYAKWHQEASERVPDSETRAVSIRIQDLLLTRMRLRNLEQPSISNFQKSQVTIDLQDASSCITYAIRIANFEVACDDACMTTAICDCRICPHFKLCCELRYRP